VNKMIKVFKSVVMCVIAMSFILPTSVFANEIISREAEEHIISQLRRANIPNAAIAVIQDGKTSYIFRDSTYDTLFQIGSVAKSFTGFGVLLLEDMGLLSAHDPVNKHLPWFEVNYNGVTVPHQDITIYTLLHHTSGLTSDERRFPSSVSESTAEEFISQLIGVELAFYPSTRHAYGNVNYIILGFLIEAVSGQSYDEFMTREVLHPLGLHNTFTYAQNAYDTGRVIGGNRLRFLQPTPWNPPVITHVIPTGYIYSDIQDMARWAGIHLGVVDISEQFERVVQRSHENIGSVDFFAHGNYFYTAGWNVTDTGSRIRHNGSTPGYSASLRIYPHDNMAVVILGNLTDAVVPFGAFITDTITGRDFGRMEMGFNTILDIFLTVLAISGIVYVVLLIRLFVRLIKRLRSGEVIKASFTPKNVKWLFDPIFSIAGLVAIYIVPPIFGNTSFEFAMMFVPASYVFALIATWIGVTYSICALLAKIFVATLTN